jgi:hypothetical protein
MDLFSIGHNIWRHKLATLPVILLTALGLVYALALKQPVYQTTSSFALISPPAPPTNQQLAQDPALGRVNSNNPFVNYGDLSIVADLLAQVVSADSERTALVKQGADGSYVVAPDQQFGLNAPLLQITGVGSTAQAAIRTATLVGQALSQQMDALQSARGVDSRYWIQPLQVTGPDQATLQLSSKLRLVLGVLGIGVILMFVMVSVMSAREERATRKRLGAEADLASALKEPAAPRPLREKSDLMSALEKRAARKRLLEEDDLTSALEEPATGTPRREKDDPLGALLADVGYDPMTQKSR